MANSELQSSSARFRDEPSVTAGYVAAIMHALEHRGVDSAEAMTAAGLPENISNDPLKRLSVSQVTRLYEVCVDRTDDPYFGLTVARFILASNIHALGYALLASRTLLDFCLRLERYFAIVSQSVTLRVERREGEVIVRFRLLADLCGETEDAFTAFALRFMRRLYGRPFAPLRVEMHRPCPGPGPQPYLDEFGVMPTFGHVESALAFTSPVLDEPLASACPDLAQFHDRIAAECLVRLNRGDVVARARAVILERLATGNCSRRVVARELGLSQAALQLKLGERGTGFQDLLDETRHELARGYLAQPDMSITEIAFLLGFTDASNFTRAFRRWQGESPSRYRDGSTGTGKWSG